MYKMKWDFKEKNTYETRRSEGERLQRQYPDRCAVIVERAPNSKLENLSQTKFLVPTDISVAQFQCLVRKRLNIRPEEAIFFFVHNTIPVCSMTMGSLYHQHSDEDKFLYVAYTEESYFG